MYNSNLKGLSCVPSSPASYAFIMSLFLLTVHRRNKSEQPIWSVSDIRQIMTVSDHCQVCCSYGTAETLQVATL